MLIAADAGQIEQVLINVVKNALEAMETDGIIMFSTLQTPPQLVIADNGKGLSKERAAQLFTPFLY